MYNLDKDCIKELNKNFIKEILKFQYLKDIDDDNVTLVIKLHEDIKKIELSFLNTSIINLQLNVTKTCNNFVCLNKMNNFMNSLSINSFVNINVHYLTNKILYFSAKYCYQAVNILMSETNKYIFFPNSLKYIKTNKSEAIRIYPFNIKYFHADKYLRCNRINNLKYLSFNDYIKKYNNR